MRRLEISVVLRKSLIGIISGIMFHSFLLHNYSIIMFAKQYMAKAVFTHYQKNYPNYVGFVRVVQAARSAFLIL